MGLGLLSGLVGHCALKGRLDAAGGVGSTAGTPTPLPSSPLPGPAALLDCFQSWGSGLAGSGFSPVSLISRTWRHNPLMGTSAWLLRGR